MLIKEEQIIILLWAFDYGGYDFLGQNMRLFPN